jgi:hypothetical protein
MEIHAADGLKVLQVIAPELDASFEVGGESPVQAFGKVLNRDLYFRARHDSWTFDVADETGLFPSDGSRGPDTYFREGHYEGASYMPHAEAVKLILRCLADYTGVHIHIGALKIPAYRSKPPGPI